VAAAIVASRFLQAHRMRSIAAGSRQIVSKLDSYALRQNQKRSGASVGVSLLTIWRAAAATEASWFLQAYRVRRIAAGSRQIVSKLDSHALRAESKAVRRFCGSQLADDLARSGSNERSLATPGTPPSRPRERIKRVRPPVPPAMSRTLAPPRPPASRAARRCSSYAT
jgi:hypothetical protein